MPLRRPMLRALAEFCEDAQERAWMELLCSKVSGGERGDSNPIDAGLQKLF